MSALRRDKGKTSVLVVRDNAVHEVPVRVGTDNGSEAEVLSGLYADDRVVLQPRAQPHDGSPVRVTQAESESRPSAH